MMRQTHHYVFLCFIVAALGADRALGQDAAAGAHLFKTKCGICHSPEPGTNKIGPSLFGVVGRPAGHIEDFDYSEANRTSGITWDLPTLDRYLTGPQAMVPGTKMTFPGLKDPAERGAVIAYLATLQSEGTAR
jgi:cytochrome c